MTGDATHALPPPLLPQLRAARTRSSLSRQATKSATRRVRSARRPSSALVTRPATQLVPRAATRPRGASSSRVPRTTACTNVACTQPMTSLPPFTESPSRNLIVTSAATLATRELRSAGPKAWFPHLFGRDNSPGWAVVAGSINIYCPIPIIHKKDMPIPFRFSPPGYSWETARLCLVFDLGTLGENDFC